MRKRFNKAVYLKFYVNGKSKSVKLQTFISTKKAIVTQV